MAKARICTRCGAPLTALTAGSVKCQFCGTISSERTRAPHVQAPSEGPQKPVAIVTAVGAICGLLALGAVFVLMRGDPPERTRHVRTVSAPMPAPVSPQVPRPTPAPPPAPLEWGQLMAVTVDERGDLLALFDDTLVKVDRKTFTAKWSSPFSKEWRSLGNHRIIVPRGAYVAVISDRTAGFFEAATGAKVNDFKYRRGGILQRVCAAGSTQVLVDVLGEELQRFDAATGLRAKSGPDCQLREKVGCPSTQRCGWQRLVNDTYSCRYGVGVGRDTFHDCVTEDGQKRPVFVAQGGVTWEVPSNFGGVDSYFGVVDETLIAAGHKGIVALSTATGDERWRVLTERTSAVAADGTTLFLSKEGTLVAVNARTGEELQRLPLRSASATAE